MIEINREDTPEEVLDKVIDQLLEWADESKSGGWSTHHVKPQKDLASNLMNYLRRPGLLKSRIEICDSCGHRMDLHYEDGCTFETRGGETFNDRKCGCQDEKLRE